MLLRLFIQRFGKFSLNFGNFSSKMTLFCLIKLLNKFEKERQRNAKGTEKERKRNVRTVRKKGTGTERVPQNWQRNGNGTRSSIFKNFQCLGRSYSCPLG